MFKKMFELLLMTTIFVYIRLPTHFEFYRCLPPTPENLLQVTPPIVGKCVAWVDGGFRLHSSLSRRPVDRIDRRSLIEPFPVRILQS